MSLTGRTLGRNRVLDLIASNLERRFADMKDPVKDNGAAVDAYLDEHAIDWEP